MTQNIIGIMGAMPEEVHGLIALLENAAVQEIGQRTYYTGSLQGQQVVIVFSRWGKVAAAATATTLIQTFNVRTLIFTGVAGAIDANIRVGDVVLGNALVQHDMDARPLMPQFEIPLLATTYFQPDTHLLAKAKQTIHQVLGAVENLCTQEELATFHIKHPQLHLGLIASGDTFFSSHTQKENLQQGLPAVLCVEMEGAAVAQICYEYQIPFVVIRTVSDAADDQSVVDFPKFIETVCSKYAVAIVMNLLKVIVA